MKKYFLILLLLVSSIDSYSQFKIDNKLFATGFANDTAVSISIKVISLDILLNSVDQRPTFYLSFNDKTGRSIMSRNINYTDMETACTKNGIPAAQHATVIAQTFGAVYVGTKTQKLSAIRGLLDTYGIVVKADTEQ